MTRYYVLRRGGEVRRVAKIISNAIAYGYDGGDWVEMSNLLRIIYDITDFEEISEAEARSIIEEVYRK